VTTLRGFWSSRSGALLDRLCPRRGREEEASAPADTLRVRFECEDVPGPSDCVMGREPVDFVIPDDEDSVEDLSEEPDGADDSDESDDSDTALSGISGGVMLLVNSEQLTVYQSGEDHDNSKNMKGPRSRNYITCIREAVRMITAETKTINKIYHATFQKYVSGYV